MRTVYVLSRVQTKDRSPCLAYTCGCDGAKKDEGAQRVSCKKIHSIDIHWQTIVLLSSILYMHKIHMYVQYSVILHFRETKVPLKFLQAESHQEGPK